MRQHRSTLSRLSSRLETRLAPAMFTVTSLGDAGTGSGNSGDLRYCLNLANINGTADSVTFGTLFNSPQSIVLSKDLAIAEPISIVGPTGGVTIDANGVGRVFDIFNFGPVINVALSNLNLTGGKATDVINQARGGAIRASSVRLSLANCSITNSEADGGGGAIGIVGGSSTITISDSVLAGNMAGVGVPTPDGWGGAIDLIPVSTLIVQRSTLSGNTAQSRGGAINVYAGGTVQLIESTLSGNRSLGNGGAVSLDAYYGAANLTVRNSTISGNSAALDGGAVSLWSGASAFTAENSTFTNNTAGQHGGAISCAGNAVVTANSSIIAANLAGAIGADFHANAPLTVSAKQSLIGVADSANVTVSGTGNKTGTVAAPLNPQLAALANNGGPTASHLPLPGSPAIDAGGNDSVFPNDQRGLHFPRTRGLLPDIGALEASSKLPNGSASAADITTAGGTAYQFQVTYVDTNAVDVSSIGDGDVVVTGPGSFSAAAKLTGVDFPNNGSPRTATYSISPPGGAWDPLDNGVYIITQATNQVFDGDAPVNAAPAVVLGKFVAGMPVPYVVDLAADEFDGNYIAGDLSLREAIFLAGQNSTNNDLIAFAPGVTSIALTLGEIAVGESLTIAGPGVSALTVSGGNAGRLLSLTGANATLTISGVTLTGGSAQSGGAILLAANQSLTLSEVALSGNHAANGGGVFLGANSTLTLNRSTVSGNSAQGLGGGVYFQNGGGLSINASTLSGNTAATGGGLYFYGVPTSPISLRNSTVAHNTASTGQGGGLALMVFGGAVAIENSTFAANSAATNGGGVYFAGVTGLALSSTIVAANAAPVGPDVASGLASAVSGDNNLIGVANSGGFSLSGTGNKTGTAATPLGPVLGQLKNNGGPTQTMLPMPGSPAIDAGNNLAALASDQRGIGFARVSGVQADIGAAEVQVSQPPTATITIDNGNGQRSMIRSITVAFNEPVVFANASTAFVLQRLPSSASPGPSGAVALSISPASGPASTFTITFNDSAMAPAVGAAKSLRDGKYELTLSAAELKSAASALPLDGNGNGIGGDNGTVNFSRLFGDQNGDGTTDNVDFLAFRSAIGSSGFGGNYDSSFDVDGDGNNDLTDFIALRARLGLVP